MLELECGEREMEIPKQPQYEEEEEEQLPSRDSSHFYVARQQQQRAHNPEKEREKETWFDLYKVESQLTHFAYNTHFFFYTRRVLAIW